MEFDPNSNPPCYKTVDEVSKQQQPKLKFILRYALMVMNYNKGPALMVFSSFLGHRNPAR